YAQSGDLRGIWKAEGNAYRDLENAGVISDPPSGKIPYRPEAQKLAAANFARRVTADPDSRCFQPGVPRATLLPYAFQILQNERAVYFVYERAHSYRILYLGGKPHNDGLSYAMGDSWAHWEGGSLVADVASFSDQTWLDAAGHRHSDQLHVVERYTRTSPENILYEATVEDPRVFTMPWKFRVTLRRQPGAELTEDECDVDSAGARHHVTPFKKVK
ncbi:MAG: hypothetical protein JOZ22_17140, partial [Acidobacteriia bacterium]|nr:hypothetical protein [Terriglobia bacterium]